jgi:hypothetical protein
VALFFIYVAICHRNMSSPKGDQVRTSFGLKGHQSESCVMKSWMGTFLLLTELDADLNTGT